MESIVTLRDEPAMTVAYLRRQGRYTGIPEALGRLYQHMTRNGLTPAGPPIGVFFTDPKTVPEDRAQWEMRWPIAEAREEAEPGADGVGIRRLAVRTLATMVHVGRYASVGPAYAATHDWVEAHRYTVVGPPEEAYLSEPDTPPEEVRTEVRLPVALEPVAFGD